MSGLSKITNDMPDIENGLSTEEVKRRLAEYGYNEVPEREDSLSCKTSKVLLGIVPWMLEATAFLTWVLGKYPDMIIIVGLLCTNAVLSIIRQRKSDVALESLKQRLSIQSRVKRDGI